MLYTVRQSYMLLLAAVRSTKRRRSSDDAMFLNIYNTYISLRYDTVDPEGSHVCRRVVSYFCRRRMLFRNIHSVCTVTRRVEHGAAGSSAGRGPRPDFFDFNFMARESQPARTPRLRT